MSTLAKFGLWQKAREPAETTLNHPKPGKASDETRADAGSNRVNHENRVSEPSHTRDRENTRNTHTNAPHAHGVGESPGLGGLHGLSQQFRDPLPGLKIGQGGLPGFAALSPDDPGDEGLKWAGEVEEPIAGDRIGEDPEPHRAYLAPPAGSLQARLVAVGATVNTYGKRASVRAPADLPLELVREVEARGWAIIPGGLPNPEAEHDSWAFGGIGIRELD